MKNKLIAGFRDKRFSWLNSEEPSLGLIYSQNSRLPNLPLLIQEIAEHFSLPVLNGRLGNLLNIVIGGDGTTLGLVRSLQNLAIPVFGIKGGSYNAAPLTAVDQVRETLWQFLEGHYKLESRNLLSAQVPFVKVHKDQFNQPIYDFHKGRSRLGIRVINEISFDYTGDSPLQLKLSKLDINFEGDGVMISTALGSTAHSASYHGLEIPANDTRYVITPLGPYRSSEHPEIRQFLSSALEVPKSFRLLITYIRKRAHIENGFRIRIDNLTPVYVPRLFYGTEIKSFEVNLHQSAPWYIVRNIN